MEVLPIDAVLPQVISSLKSAGALVLKAAPGAGKTTRVPPAILDAGLADLADKNPGAKKAGQIVVLQPRRVAARAAATRISEERGTTLGAEVGYRVRHEGKSSRDTRILVCTTGVFLRRLQDDPRHRRCRCRHIRRISRTQRRQRSGSGSDQTGARRNSPRPFDRRHVGHSGRRPRLPPT